MNHHESKVNETEEINELTTNQNYFNFDNYFNENNSKINKSLSEELKTDLTKIDYLFVKKNVLEQFDIGLEAKVIEVDNEGENTENFISVNIQEGYEYSKKILQTESIFTDLDSGLTLAGAINYLKINKLQDQELNIVVIFEDNPYETKNKIFNENWLVTNKILSPETLYNSQGHWGNKKFEEFENLKACNYYDKRITIGDCYDLFKKGKLIIPIRQSGEIIGVVDKKSFLKNYLNKNLDKNDSCYNILNKNFIKLSFEIEFSAIRKILETSEYVLIEKRNSNNNKLEKVFTVTNDDLLESLEKKMKEFI